MHDHILRSVSLLLFICIGCTPSGPPPIPKPLSPQNLTKSWSEDGAIEIKPAVEFTKPSMEVISAWRKAKALYGYMWTDNHFYGACEWREEGNGEQRGWPAFICNQETVTGLTTVPDPGLEFGLTIYTSRITAEQVRQLDRFTSLRILEFGHTPLPADAVRTIAQLAKLRALGLKETGLTDEGLKQLRTLTDLEILDLSVNPLTSDGLAVLPNLKKLRSLNMYDTAGMDAKVLRSISQLGELEFLNLMSSPLTDGALKELIGLKKLCTLNVCDTSISDEGLIHIEQLKSLRFLRIKNTQITEAGRLKLAKAMPDCVIEY
jgi:Leucine-rich repeat (LRR) protein